ncbi:MAG: sigma-70 family RNA polymerase sigma factor [Ruminiclostridium sp.]|nr:sigma-70 family RNA polymerase sigma factor [Ruminiclostridium sp.]
MNIRKILESHKEIDDRINLGLEEIAQLRSLAERVTQRFPAPGEGLWKGGISDRVGNYAVKIADLELRIDKEIDSLIELKEKILEMTSALDDSVERMVTERRYIMHESTETIAEKLGYSPRHITRIQRSALAHLEEMFGNSELIA